MRSCGTIHTSLDARLFCSARLPRLEEIKQRLSSHPCPLEQPAFSTKGHHFISAHTKITSAALYVRAESFLRYCKEVTDALIQAKVLASLQKKRSLNTVRAEQLEEEARGDLLMEVERIKAMEAYELRERRRAEDRRAGAQVLHKQIEERAAERQRQEELKEQEAAQMLREVERMKEEEIQKLIEKRETGRRLLAEVALTNKEQIERKRQIAHLEKEEDERIASYNRQRELKEQAELEERERIKKQKEREVARMRAQQERAADKQAELDELRARRAQEEYEREWRAKERAEVERQAAINRDLKQAREQQKLVKMKQLSDTAAQEEEEFRRIIDAQRQREEEEAIIRESQMAVRRRHKEEILSQIRTNEERKAAERKEHLEEGARMREEYSKQRARLEQIKERKLEELERMGVPPKYRAELAKTKFMK